MQLQYKITLSVLFVSLSTLLLVSFLYSQLTYKSILQHEEELLTDNAVEAAREVKFELLSKLDNVKTLASAPIIFEYLKESNRKCKEKAGEVRSQHLKQLNRRWITAENKYNEFIKPYINNELALFLKQQQTLFSGVYGEIFITNSHGLVVATTSKQTTLLHAHKYWFKEAYADGVGKVFFDDRGFDASVNGYVIGIVVPIKENGQVIGILKANINIMGILDSHVDNYLNLNKGKLKIVRTKGDIVYEHPLPPLSTSINPKIIPELQKMNTGSKIIQNYKQEVLVAYTPIDLSLESKNILFGGEIKTADSIKGNNREIWHTVICYEKSLALGVSTQTNKVIIAIGLSLTFLSLIITLFLAKRISKPIDDLNKAQAKLLEQEDIMITQSKHAAMGEMISMIAHQWRQPISVISMQANNILLNIELDTLETESLKKTAKNIGLQTQELSKTIDDFRNFFKPNKHSGDVYFQEILDSTFSVIGKSIQSNKIELLIDKDESLKIDTYERELVQVFINIINNAKDVLVENSVQEAKIFITIKQHGSSAHISICDNGGGIDEEIMDEIFNPYFSTKGEKNGTGLGLYMSKTIVNKHLKGIISSSNVNGGACFNIILPLSLKKVNMNLK